LYKNSFILPFDLSLCPLSSKGNPSPSVLNKSLLLPLVQVFPPKGAFGSSFPLIKRPLVFPLVKPKGKLKPKGKPKASLSPLGKEGRT